MIFWELVQSIRQHHALEHATIHVLNQHNPHRKLMGRSGASGFWIYGRLPTQDLASAASEALARLQHGEAHLAVHPRCGTNLAVTGILTGTAVFGATLGRPRSKWDRLPLAITVATLAAVLAQPLAHRVQEQITTYPMVDDLQIAEVQRFERGDMVFHRVIVGKA